MLRCLDFVTILPLLCSDTLQSLDGRTSKPQVKRELFTCRSGELLPYVSFSFFRCSTAFFSCLGICVVLCILCLHSTLVLQLCASCMHVVWRARPSSSSLREGEGSSKGHS